MKRTDSSYKMGSLLASSPRGLTRIELAKALDLTICAAGYRLQHMRQMGQVRSGEKTGWQGERYYHATAKLLDQLEEVEHRPEHINKSLVQQALDSRTLLELHWR